MNKGLRLFYRGSGISFADDEKMKWKGLGCFSSTLCVASWTLSVLSPTALKDCPCAAKSSLLGVWEHQALAPEDKPQHCNYTEQGHLLCACLENKAGYPTWKS